MFISKLINIIEDYDKYGEHRINGLKAVYTLMMLFLINMVYSIPNPYFNYFYIPLTSLAAEIAGETVKQKYLLYFYAVSGSIISVFLYSITIIYPLIFLFFVFFFSLGLYLFAININRNLIVTVPIILSLAVYSLSNGQINTSFYIALNNSLITILAMIIVMTSILFFPLRYYFRAWLRAFRLMLRQVLSNFELALEQREIELVQPHLIMMVKYARLLPRKLPTFNILKINILMNELRLLSSVEPSYSGIDTEQMIAGLRCLINAVDANQECPAETSNPLVLTRIILTWNRLCCKI